MTMHLAGSPHRHSRRERDVSPPWLPPAVGHRIARWSVAVLVALLAASPAPADVDDIAENRSPTGGSNIFRACRGGADAGTVCDADGDCDSNDCSLGRIDLTANLKRLRCNGGSDDNDPCIVDDDCAGGTCDDVRGWNPTAGEMSSIRGFFQNEVNDALYEVTDGQICLRNVSLVVDNQAPNAVIQVTAGECDGQRCAASSECTDSCRSTTAWADTGDWGAGGAIRIWSRNLEAPKGFIHEFMHLFANVRDEYEGKLNALCGEDLFRNRCYGGEKNGEECNGACILNGMATGVDCLSDDECLVESECNFGICDVGPMGGEPCNDDADCDAGFCDVETDCAEGGVCAKTFCIDDPGASDCVMRSAGGIELCYSGDHDHGDPQGVLTGAASDTEQHICREGRSCWSQFATEWPSFVSVPVGGPDPSTGSAPSPDCDVSLFEPSVQNQLVLVIDRSHSMRNEDPDRIEVARDVAGNAIDQLMDDARLGIASFSSADIVMVCSEEPADVCTTDMDCENGTCVEDDIDDPDPLGFDATQEFPDPGDPAAVVALSDDLTGATRTDAKDALDDLVSRTGGYTNIGAGLLKALDMIEASGGPNTLNTSVILLTDGQNNRGNLGSALDELSDAGIPVFLSCIGEARENPEQCAEIADRTSGAYVDSSVADLNAAYVELAARIQGEEIVQSSLDLPLAAGAPVEMPARIEGGVRSARFAVTWLDDASNIDLTLIDPGGDELPCGTDLVRGGFCVFDDPDPGLWTLRIEIAAGSDTVSAHAVVDHPALTTVAGLGRANLEWSPGAGFLVFAHPALLAPIAGCDVSADVVRTRVSGGAVEETFVGTLELRDDGLEGDPEPDDGAYHAFFRRLLPGGGIYTFTVSTRCDPAEGAHYHVHPDPQDTETEVFDQQLGSAFTRVSRFSGVATGVPEDRPPVALICDDVRAECDGELTEAGPLDGTCSFDPEESALTFAWAPPASFVDPSLPNPTGSFPRGYNTVSLEVTDEDALTSVPDTATVLIADTLSPDLDEPDPITLECNTEGGVAGDDPQILEWLALAAAVDLCEGEILTLSNDAPDLFPVGCPPGQTTDVAFTAGDSTGNETVEHSSVTVTDTVPPAIEVVLEPREIWPPNHRLVTIDAEVTVDDVCDAEPTFVLTSITSDEPDDAIGAGDGNTVDDIQDAAFGTPDLTFRLRAERAGTGEGRTYTVTYTATDSCGNEQDASATVFVPHDR